MLGALILAAALSIEEHALMPLVSAPQWSPDGTRVAYVLTRADLGRGVYDADVWVIGADGTGDRRLTFAAGADTRPRWSPDGTRLAFLSDRDGTSAVHVLDLRGGEPRRLTKDSAAMRDFEWSPDGTRIAFLRTDGPGEEEQRRAAEKNDARVFGTNARATHIYVADVESGETHQVTRGAMTVFSLAWSPDGRSLTYDAAPDGGLDGLYRTDIYVVSADGGEPRAVVARPGLDRGPKFSPDGKWIAFTSGGGKAHWIVEHDLNVVAAEGGTPRVLTAAYGRTLEAFEWSEDSRAIWFEGPWNVESRLFRVNVDGSAFATVAGTDQVVTEADVRGARAVFVAQSLTEPPELHVFDGRTTRRLTNHAAAYRDRELGETRVVRWKNPQDGLEIEGLLTLPLGYRGGRVPLITFVHGGPASNFHRGFLGYIGTMVPMHALTARGFAVLRPNPRGSGAYGLAFRRANANDWGGMDWSDVEAGVDKVIADGIADPGRLGLLGWSYGGYLAAFSLAKTDRYRAVVIGAGITDLLTYHATSDVQDFIPAYFDGMRAEVLQARSPLWQVRPTRARVLILHGENDDRVPVAQSVTFYRRLKSLGADATLVLYPRSGHGLREPKLRMDFGRRVVELFESTLTSAAAPPSSPVR
jgi:dipeptidyl aminopeptidase/acylaminoacyl peptidase